MPREGNYDPDSYGAVCQSVKSLSESMSELKERMKEVEKRTRELETGEIEEIKRIVYKLENYISNSKTVDETRKERWSIALNFVVQLIWVVMASYVLTKLGIGMGPV